ncbi:uncharacterized protein [Prorops nasuta]|uniref:uncharacterized protein n=1 Tax=Prorops nasuta TaxID=863751 RepID=UPI0034CDA4C3
MTKGKVNPVFPYDEDEKELEPIVFNVAAKYNHRVKVHNWQLHDMQEPRDQVKFQPPEGNLHRAHYRRFGPDNNTWLTETQAMLHQINLKDQYKPAYPRRNLINVNSFAIVDDDKSLDDDIKLQDLIVQLEKPTEYKTTTESDYKLHFPLKEKPPPLPPVPEPWMLNRRSLGYDPESLERRDGFNTFLDDNLENHHRIAALKQQRTSIHSLTNENPFKYPEETVTLLDHTKIQNPIICQPCSLEKNEECSNHTNKYRCSEQPSPCTNNEEKTLNKENDKRMEDTYECAKTHLDSHKIKLFE